MSLRNFPRHFSEQFPGLLGQPILVAISGGADSVALLHLLRHSSLQLHIEAAHVHHSARGDEADRDASFCEELCGRLGLPFHHLQLGSDSARPEGRESTWRRLRYRALLDQARLGGMAAVATGHHRDDVAEGVLMQMLRGAGPRALAGIAAETTDGVIRPLLPWRHADIVAWLVDNNIRWIEDSSNQDLGHLRNRVRHRLLPLLREDVPRVADHLVHLAGALADDEALLADELLRRAPFIEPWRADGGVPLKSVATLPPALRSRWLHAQAERVGIGRVTRRQQEELVGLLDRGSPRAVSLAGRWRLRRAGGRLWLEPPGDFPSYRHRLEVGRPVRLTIPGWTVELSNGPMPAADADWHWPAPNGTEIEVRSPLAAERVTVGDGTVSVRKLLSRRVPRHLRGAWPVICESDTIAWIPGIWHTMDAGVRGSLLVEVRCR